ncbi:hypothetical protein QZH41_019214 [Actinostola sp. cb2023]|nr:hypothetical protein QZH41_019214 [Actinostola sp. cb2023]
MTIPSEVLATIPKSPRELKHSLGPFSLHCRFLLMTPLIQKQKALALMLIMILIKLYWKKSISLKLRPDDPKDLTFVLEEDHIPEGFLRGDIQASGRRHLIFASDKQLAYLAKAKTWYIDGTFKLCRHPFVQLLSINGFVQKEDYAKQVPLLFVLMSGRKKKDYKKVLRKVLSILPSEPRVKEVVLDFERALWSCIRKEMVDVNIVGCAFHWTQAVWRKIQAHGLSTQYEKDNGTYEYLRKILALPFLPAEAIKPTWQQLKGNANTPALRDLVNYVNDTWIEGNTWPPSAWSVYGRSIRTNNDLEGWHNALNRRACGKGQLPMYLLIKLLHNEASLVSLQIRLVSEKKLRRIQRRKYRQLQAKIFEQWAAYEANEKTAIQLLSACSRLCAGPC